MFASDNLCSVAIEDVFGPLVARGCLDGFDFTLLFEETILTILPLAVALVLAPVRLVVLHKEAVKIRYSYHEPCKVMAYVAYMALQLVLLSWWAKPNVARTQATLATTALSLAAFIPLMWLSHWEHRRSLRPSTLLTVYLGLSLLLDLARVRTLFFFPAGPNIASVFLASYCVKILLLALELTEKRQLVLGHWKTCGPEDTASAYRRALFLWLNRLFARSYRSQLSLETLPKIDDDILSASDPVRLRSRWAGVNKSNRHALLWTFMMHYKWTVLSPVLPRLAYTGFTFSQPFLIKRVLSFTASSSDNKSTNVAYGLIGAYAIVYIGAAISLTLYEHKVYRTLSKFRGSLVTLIYEKALLLSSSGAWTAESITLMSADIDRLGICAQDVHELYAGTLEVALCIWLLYVYLGVGAAAAAGFNALCLLASFPIATAAGKAQVPWLDAIETRLTATAQALGSFKLVRMTGLTEGVSSALRSLRSAEILAARRYRIFNIFLSIGYFLSYAFTPVFGFGTYVLVAQANNSGTLTEDTAFAALAIFQLLNKPTVMVIDAIEHVQTVIECFTRFQSYLTRAEQEAYRFITSEHEGLRLDRAVTEESIQLRTLTPTTENAPHVAATMDRLTFRYFAEQKPVLQGVSLEIPNFQTTMIVGPVGCGKSSLLKLLLGEAPPPENKLYTHFSRAAYCAQQPWVFKASVRENIVGMSSWDEAWYREVLRACALVTDIDNLPHGDQTGVGMRGGFLSGGQRARLSLARALYSREPVLILDDVLTGLDPATERGVSAAVFGPEGLVKRCRSTVIMATSSADHIRFADRVIILEQGGRVTHDVPAKDFPSIGHEIQRQDDSQSPQTTNTNQNDLNMALSELGIPANDREAAEAADASRQTGDIKAYAFYGCVAGWMWVLTWLFFTTVFMFGLNFPSVWLQWWVDANESNPNARLGYWLGVFTGLACLAIIANIISDYTLQLVIVPKTSAKFHELLLATTSGACTAFLTTTHEGSILNRFSQDLELIDSDLPGSLDKTMFSILQTVFTTVLVFIGSGYLAIALPACLLVVYGIQHYYLRTSRQMRHVDIEAREPLFASFLDTVTSVDSIRAYGWVDQYKRRNRDALNTSQSPYYLMWSIQRWLTLVLNLFVAGLAILLVAIATNFHRGSTAYLGVALSNIVNFGTTLQLLVTDWTQLETAICAVNRIRTYTSGTDPEISHSDEAHPPLNWPTEGTIVFEGVTASYPLAEKPVLRNINLTISSGEKVAICGRTGSGKSTLMSTLLRMVDLDAGTITIDGINIASLPREAVRRRLTTMPQETFFITGTVRQNLDPFGIATDESLVSVLGDLGLRDMLDEAGGLDAEMNNDMFSSGQAQLFCLARAIVRGGPILLLDEATSSVDSATSDLMQQALHKTFGKKTVISIAHRLETVTDYDRIIVLEKGEIIESGSPQDLLAAPSSAFKLLFESMTGHA